MSLHSAISSRYKTYPDYKDSGVERLGLIPEPWKSVRLKHVLKIRNGRDYKEVEVESGGYPVYGSGGIFKRSSKYLFDGKSVLFGRKGTIDKPLLVSGRFWTVDTMFYSEIYDKAIPEYIYYQSLFFPFDLLTTNTALPSMTQEDLLELDFILPPKAEQRQIINFLDHQTAKIDSLIEKQQRLIELLTEKRQAVISHAVTKGLNPDVPMKDSGVEWLGEVPEHWEVTKVGYHALKIGSGKTPRGGSELYLDEGVLFLRSQNVYDDGLRIGESESVFISETTHDEMSNSKVFDGDILLNITGGSIGRSCLVPYGFAEANVNQHVCIIRVPEYLQEYLAYVMKSLSIKVQIDSIQSGSNREGVNFEQIANFVFCLPDISEIKEIISYIKSEEIRFISLINKAHQAIQLMQERRTALISAAVTGKIDVRDWVRPE